MLYIILLYEEYLVLWVCVYEEYVRVCVYEEYVRVCVHEEYLVPWILCK